MLVKMKKYTTKLLWKIEELWHQYRETKDSGSIDVSINYKDTVSKYHPDFHCVQNFNFEKTDYVVHIDSYGEYRGLNKSQVLINQKKPIYLFDNHNKMIYPLVELHGIVQKPLNIIHIDAHPDDAIFQGKKKKSLSLEETKSYIEKTRISDFFDALSETQIINTVYPVTHSDSFEFFLPPEEPYILSLDIDIFGPEGDFCELKDKVRAIALAWNRADAICIATSPGFIDQEFAREIISIFTQK